VKHSNVTELHDEMAQLFPDEWGCTNYVFQSSSELESLDRQLFYAHGLGYIPCNAEQELIVTTKEIISQMKSNDE